MNTKAKTLQSLREDRLFREELFEAFKKKFKIKATTRIVAADLEEQTVTMNVDIAPDEHQGPNAG